MSYRSCTDVDTPEPGQYDSPASRGGGNVAIASQMSRVSKEWPTTHGRPRMGNDARGTGDREQLPAEQAALTARLHRLGERLDRIRPEAPAEQAQAARPGADSSAMARGFRLSSELVAGVLVGAAIGWLIDRWLGISPWGMIVFLLLGFAAGVLNVMRAAGVVPPNRMDPPSSKE